MRDLLKSWYLVLFSLLLLLGGTVFYIKFAAKSYKVRASVLLKIEKSNAYGSNPDDMMRVYDLIEKDKNLQNEMLIIQSSPLIKAVIEEMDLAVSYYQQEDKLPKELEFSMKDLYKEAPFIVLPEQGAPQPIGVYFYISVIDEETYRISASSKDAMIVDLTDESVILEKTAFHLSGVFRFGEIVGNSFTSFRVLLNSNYNTEDYWGKDLFFKFNTISILASTFKENLKVETSALDATMVELTLISQKTQMGVDFLNALISKYIEHNLDAKNYLAIKTIEHLDFQLADISQSLGSSEDELQDIRKSSSVMNVDEKAEGVYNQLQIAEEKRAEIDRTRNSLVQMSDYFADNDDSNGFMAPSAMGLDDPLLSTLIQDLTTLNTERQQLINNNQLRSPRLRTLEITIGNLKEVIKENLHYSINSKNSELQEINNQIRELNREYASLPFTQRRLLGIERKFNLSENVYMSLLEQRIQAQIIKASNLPDCEIVEPPQYVSVYSPKKALFLIGALFMGLLLPVLFVLIKKMLTGKVLNKEELKHLTKLNLIGSIPQENKTSINVIKDQPNSIVAEAFHTLRTNIIYYLMGKQNQVILVTSSMAGEGKSFSALNLASSIANTNNKTALVEFDLRNPSELYEKLGIRGLIGVSSYLINKASLDEMVISSGLPNLDIILAGQIPPNPVELISGENTTKLFEELRSKYDYIIVDTPPYGLLTDSFILMKYADINLYVTRIGYVNKRMLTTSLEDIASKEIANIHLLINSDTHKQGAYGKYYTTPSRKFQGQRKDKGDARRKISKS
ncbi:MAG: polysaccharide biosynthesis tyrosine autokinase [Bacteroidota bacterium]